MNFDKRIEDLRAKCAASTPNADKIIAEDLMKKMEHTPGPWTVFHQEVMAGKTCVANAHGPQGRWEKVGGEHQANARLIAAAPDLLEALKTLWATLEPGEVGFRANMVRAAITKAEGAKGGI